MDIWDGDQPLDPSTWKPVALCCWCGTPLQKGLVLEAEVWVCPQKPCMERQLKWAMTVTIKGGTQKLVYLPLPRQTEAHEAVDSQQFRRILYGGAAGGGKSRFLRWLAYQLCLRYKNFNVLLLRRTWPELEETHIREAQREAPDLKAVCLPSQRVVNFPETGSILKFGHCQDDKDMTDYLSREYDLILFDELVTFTEQQYLLISSRARTTRPGWTPMVVAGTNPGGPGAAWVTELFIHKNRDTKKYPNYKASAHHFIRALLDDNPYVNESYVEFLMDLPHEMREAYRWGNWDIFPGQFFKEFRKDKHLGSIYVPPDIPRIGGMDWGYLRPGVFLWAVPLDDGRLYIEREYVFSETIASEVAKNVVALTKLWGWELAHSVGDPNMAIREGQSGEDTFETLATNGLIVDKGINDRVNGWTRLRHWLRPLPNGKPALVISPDCEYLARTLPQLLSSKTKPEDVDTTGEDHAADALRYLVMDRPAPLTISTSVPYPPDSAGALMQQLLETSVPVLGVHNVA